MTECYSARCQQDRKLARREYNKWTKNLLFQIGNLNKYSNQINIFSLFKGLETISKNHFEYDVNLFNQSDEQIPIDFNPHQACLFCLNRQEYLGSKKLDHHLISETIPNDDDENAPLDLSLKSKSPIITSNNRTNVKLVIFQSFR
jgi:hypothetical protein